MKKILSFMVVFFVAQSLFAGIQVENVRAGVGRTTFNAAKIDMVMGAATGYQSIKLTNADESKSCEIRVLNDKIDVHYYKIYNELLKLNRTKGAKIKCTNAHNTTNTVDRIWVAPYSTGYLNFIIPTVKTPVLR